MGEWHKIFHQSLTVPPCNVRRPNLPLQQSVPFQCVLKSVHGNALKQKVLENMVEVGFQLRLSLFDVAYRQFFGRTWRSPTRPLKSVPGQPPSVVFNETVYFLTSLGHPGILMVLEIVATAKGQDAASREVSCGFGFLRLFNGKSEPLIWNSTGKGLPLYQGTPRALLHPLLLEPIEKNKYLTVMENTHLQFTLQLHPPLEAIHHLLPENIPVSSGQRVPGVLAAPEGDFLQKPRLMKSQTWYLDKLTVHLYPSLEKFEEELLSLLMHEQVNSILDGTSLAIQERRLHVGVHNGLCFVQPPQVVVVVPVALPEADRTRGSSGSLRRKQGSPLKGSAEGRALILRSRIHLAEMVPHPAFGVVFLLEYVFSVASGPDGKTPSMTSLTAAAYMHSVRWALWQPVLDANSADVVLPLRGGPQLNPHHVLVYKTPPATMSSREVKQVESGTLAFHFSTSSEERLGTAAKSPGVKRETPLPPKIKSPPAASPGSPPSVQMLVSTQDYTQGPGLSMSQLLASPINRSGHALLPAVSGAQPSQDSLQPARESQATIAHLESDLSYNPQLEDGATVDQLQELPFTPVHVPILALGGAPSRSPNTAPTRASLARLRTAGFPELLDCNKEPLEMLDPNDPAPCSPQREEGDPLPNHEIHLQFLALSRPAQDDPATWPQTVYFTLQFYRFPPVTTPRLQLVQTQACGPATHILVQINPDGTLNLAPPGFHLKYLVDQASLKPGEPRWFLHYLAQQALQIDVWDGDSLLLLGSAAVKLKHLLRQGRTGVQVYHELEVLAVEYKPDATVLSGEVFRPWGVKPIGVHAAVRGQLHLRLANIGHRCEQGLRRSHSLPPSRRRVISSQDGARGFPGGSLVSISTHRAGNVCQAKKLADVDSELAALLFSRLREVSGVLQPASQEAGLTRRRKLERMLSVRRKESQEGDVGRKSSFILGRHEDRVQHSRDLQLIEAYRERIKAESITSMLCQAITTHHVIYATLGTAEFFEFALKNPYSVQHTVTIRIDNPELSIILDVREWRHFKELTQTVTPLEEDMFHLHNGLTPQVYLRPKETVYIPFKYQTFSTEQMATVQQGPPEPTSKEGEKIPTATSSGKFSETLRIKVSFTVGNGKPLAILSVSVETQPHAVDQTFRFYHPELTFLKKSIRLPPWHTLPGAPVGVPGGEPEMFVRCSDPNVICETKKMGPGEPQDIFLKVAAGSSPQIQRFFVLIYTDPWLAAPTQTWQFYLHCLQWVEASCILGQLTRLSLVLRGTHTLRKVKAFTSHPQEMKLEPDGVFILPANGVQDLHLGLQPQSAGCRFISLNLVDVEFHQLVSTWLVSMTCRQPFISKAFEIVLPSGGGKGSNKKITYTNSYPSPRAYFLHTNRPDLLHFKEDSFQVGGGETYTIGLRFAPSQNAGEEEILIYINDAEGKNEETFCVKVAYQ
ncbi:nephrocystin-4 isoform X1 [Ahaetulla prasina]|uniref:nephrocystin-4 isoform X1 n=1 Tax=Ahaetulla prasina TaxID=499056 RepID=UPI00264A282A|nr:nephrocystin-4 isoform X1 [Ahaetulla prasina]XP_058017327.1 nephrocystin-4 isoform X1 [Ahaetulla prasina]XP_058017328.1 nephrocystin-4 isoform X1 [Ahaetulla prasina]